MNLHAIKVIQDNGGVIVLVPIRMDAMVVISRSLTKVFGRKKGVIDTLLAQATGIPCTVFIGREDQDAARKALGITVGK